MARASTHRAKRHHTVTRAYLEFWADEGGRIAVFDKQTGAAYDTDPVNAAVIAGFNTVNAPGVAPDAIETGLSNGEAAAVAAITQLRSGAFPDADQRIAVARFVALHFSRTPIFRRFSDELASSTEEWLRDATAALAKNGVIPPGAVGAPQLAFAQNDHVELMLGTIEQAWRSLYLRSWTIVELPNMVTSDFPVFLNADPEVARFGVGLANAREIAFALGPNHALVLSTPYFGPDGRVGLEPEGEDYLRQRIWLSADRFVFRRPGAPIPEGIDPRRRVAWGLRPNQGAAVK